MCGGAQSGYPNMGNLSKPMSYGSQPPMISDPYRNPGMLKNGSFMPPPTDYSNPYAGLPRNYPNETGAIAGDIARGGGTIPGSGTTPGGTSYEPNTNIFNVPPTDYSNPYAGLPRNYPNETGAIAGDVARGQPQMIVDPHREYGPPGGMPTMGPSMSAPFTVNAPQPSPTMPDQSKAWTPPKPPGTPPMPPPNQPPPPNMPPGAFIDEYGIARRAPETPFVAGMGQFGQYGQMPAGGFQGSVRNGGNYIGDTLFAAQGLNQAGGKTPAPDENMMNFVNYMNSYRK